jgi:hypothetical protein
MEDDHQFEFIVGNLYTLKSAESQVNDANREAGKKIAFVVSPETVSKKRNRCAHQTTLSPQSRKEETRYEILRRGWEGRASDS